MHPEFTALRCMFLVAMHHGLHLAPEQLPAIDRAGTVPTILSAMRKHGLRARVLRNCSWEKAGALGTAYPAMAIRKDGSWVILVHVIPGSDGAKAAAIVDPAQEQEGVQLCSRETFVRSWTGTLILCKRVPRLDDENQAFGLRWFLPEIIRHRQFFHGVATAALLSNLIGLTTPLMLQVLIDKVVTHQSYQTLYAVITAFVLLTVFDGTFSYIRQRLMLLATNKIDARLGARTFQHLLGLPLHYFESQAAGVLVRHMQQTEKLRHFLTGRLFQVMLDTITLPILLLFLALYSGLLTLIVLFFSTAIAATVAAMVPAFRRRLNLLYQSEGARQAYLVETLHNMRAVKSLVLEPVRQTEWEHKVVRAVRQQADVGRIGIAGSVATGVLERLMQISVLGAGAVAVFEGELSIGALVAFTMLSGRVTGPLVQMVALINEYQEAALSVKMLGNVMNTPAERAGQGRLARPAIDGDLVFEQVTFHYPGTAAPALDRVSFRVETGQIVGVVGRSGSGKTTITRLIQAIHMPQAGMIRLGGMDLRQIEPAHLRRGVGVVLQENLLFRGSIRDNIAAARPGAPLAEIVEAARLAGADEFIDRLPYSFDTMVEENATNFSGGQRQRLAIARALLPRPRLLIFDEATSALDPESEAIIQANLAGLAAGRTMIIVSHRLASLVQADVILVLEHGRVLDFAPHTVLLDSCDVYRRLWQQQTQYLR